MLSPVCFAIPVHIRDATILQQPARVLGTVSNPSLPVRELIRQGHARPWSARLADYGLGPDMTEFLLQVYAYDPTHRLFERLSRVRGLTPEDLRAIEKSEIYVVFQLAEIQATDIFAVPGLPPTRQMEVARAVDKYLGRTDTDELLRYGLSRETLAVLASREITSIGDLMRTREDELLHAPLWRPGELDEIFKVLRKLRQPQARCELDEPDEI